MVDLGVHEHDPMSRISAECPACHAQIVITYRNPAKSVALTVYDGIPGGMPDDDGAEMLRRVATWLDRVDAAADAEFIASGSDHRVLDGMVPSIQDDLRRIADLLPPAQDETLRQAQSEWLAALDQRDTFEHAADAEWASTGSDWWDRHGDEGAAMGARVIAAEVALRRAFEGAKP